MRRNIPIDTSTLDAILHAGEELPINMRLQHLQAMREASPEHSSAVDRYLLEKFRVMRESGMEASEALEKLKELVGKLTAMPWFPAVFLNFHMVRDRNGAMVQEGSTRRFVEVHPQVERSALKRGSEVFLNSEQNVIMGVSPAGTPGCGELALFDRRTEDGRVVAKWRDDELVMYASEELAREDLKVGDFIRVDRTCWMAYERFENVSGSEFLLDEVPDIPVNQIGGLDRSFESLVSTLTSILVAPEKAQLYGLSGRNSVLMYGPPGCGKTLMARGAASEISRMSGRKCHFGVVKPAAWESPYVGMSQKAIRDTFRALADAAQGGFSVLFIDEIEAIGRVRGGMTNVHSDRSLAALLAEMNGFEDRQNVAIIAATNRKDLVDPALLERLSDLEISVSRPDIRAAKEIFSIHLPSSLPFHPNGEMSDDTREELIDTAISGFYAPNADNEICKLRFRDGKERMVRAHELVSGRLIEQVARTAKRHAFRRDLKTDKAGISRRDMEAAVEESLKRLRSTLTIHNAHAHLGDLPDDVDVVSVEPVVRKVEQVQRYRVLEGV